MGNSQEMSKLEGIRGGAGVPVSGLGAGATGHRGGLARQSTTWQAAQQLKARLQRWEEARPPDPIWSAATKNSYNTMLHTQSLSYPTAPSMCFLLTANFQQATMKETHFFVHRSKCDN